MVNVKNWLILSFSGISALIANALGGWTANLSTMVYFMIIDYLLGLMVAFIFKNSPKTDNGGLSSQASLKGLFRKIVMVVIVFIMNRIDITLGITILRNATIIGFILNETISIIENVGLMGLPLPSAVTNGIDLLKKKEGENKIE